MFNDEQVRIVFWNDPDGEFIETLPDIALAGVEGLKLDGGRGTRSEGPH